MTEQELQAIEERWRKATPGPWSGSRYGSGSHDVWTAWGLPGQREWKVAEIFGNHRVENKHGNTLVIAENDAQAIAHAPTDVSALLAEVRRMNRMAVRIYNSGYHAGHHDTVEGQYTHILPQEMDSYQADVVEELITEYAESEVADNG